METPWPNLFVIGVARAGTSSLAAYLGEHPDIFMSPLKEPYFFSDRVMRHDPFPKEADAYLRLFDRAGEARWRAEASTAYFWDAAAPARIRSASPDARFVVSLRDPVERAYSGYWHAVQLAGERRSFGDAVRQELADGRRHLAPGEAPGYVAAGFYLEPLRRWQALAGPRLHVLFFDDLVRDARGEVEKILRWLGVDSPLGEDASLDVRNASVAPRNAALHRVLTSTAARAIARRVIPRTLHARVEGLMRSTSTPPMPPDIRELLASVYASERQDLRAALGREPPW